jgi:hypothetical protein
MPKLQFKPVKEPYISHAIGDKNGSYISVSLKHWNIQQGVQIETGERLESLAGNLRVYSKFSEPDGYVGILSYNEGVEQPSFYIQVNVPADEFIRLTHLFLNSSVALVDIETPLRDEKLSFGLLPSDPKIWRVKDQCWVPLESCVISFKPGGDVE